MPSGTTKRESARRIGLTSRKGGNQDYTIKIFPNADHALLVSPGKGAEWEWERPAPGWLELMVGWLQKRTK